MAARDFKADQSYMISHHRLHNRLLHGWGIVCGLEVEHHPNPACRSRWIRVTAGVAIDCYGRELIVPADLSFELPLAPGGTCGPRPRRGRLLHGPTGAGGAQLDEAETFALPFLVCLRYCEEAIDQVPVLYNESACGQPHREPNRIREGADLVVYRPEDLPRCWPPLGDCPEPGEVATVACLDPDCSCGHVVPLALIADPTADNIQAGWAFAIDERDGARSRPRPACSPTSFGPTGSTGASILWPNYRRRWAIN